MTLVEGRQADVKTRTKSSVSLWSLFIEFEVKQGRPLRAKTLLQRALVECPWAKGEAFQASRYRRLLLKYNCRSIHDGIHWQPQIGLPVRRASRFRLLSILPFSVM
jgi:hypothetical protein